MYSVVIFANLNLHGLSSRKQWRIYFRDADAVFSICYGGATYSQLLPGICLWLLKLF